MNGPKLRTLERFALLADWDNVWDQHLLDKFEDLNK
jgi:hypothetical protein